MDLTSRWGNRVSTNSGSAQNFISASVFSLDDILLTVCFFPALDKNCPVLCCQGFPRIFQRSAPSLCLYIVSGNTKILLTQGTAPARGRRVFTLNAVSNYIHSTIQLHTTSYLCFTKTREFSDISRVKVNFEFLWSTDILSYLIHPSWPMQKLFVTFPKSSTNLKSTLSKEREIVRSSLISSCC